MNSSDIKNHSNQPVISVGIIGCSNHCLSKQWVCKQMVSNQIADSVGDDNESLNDPFEWMRGLKSGIKNARCSQKSMLWLYDDVESGTIYFNLKSHRDLKQLNQTLKDLCESSSSYSYHRILQSTENVYIKSLLFLFLCCHHILLFCESPRFNPQWLSIFKLLQELKLKLISPLISISKPLFAHIIGDNESQENLMHYLSNHNLSPFIIPVLTFFYPAPNSNGSIVFDDLNMKNNNTTKHIKKKNKDVSLLHRAVVRKFTVRLQQQIAVLLRRCHAVFPYFQTQHCADSVDDDDDDLDGGALEREREREREKKKYLSLSHKELFECIDELRDLGFDTLCYFDEEIYSTHSRWIETDDMMHNNPLSLFCLLPNRFISIYGNDLISSMTFLFAHKLNKLNNQGRPDALNRISSLIGRINCEISSYLIGRKSKVKNKKSHNNNNKHKHMPSRIHYYVSCLEVYDSLFQSRLHVFNLRIFNLFNYSLTRKRKNKKFYAISLMECEYSKIAFNLDIDRLCRYSSLLCRRAYKSARLSYLRDLPEMYPFSLHCFHIKLAMRVFRQQSVAPLQEYYCRQLYFELSEIYQTGGRQACAAVSLTGRPCCRPIHDGKNLNLNAMKKNESAKFAEERHSKFGRDPLGHFSGFSSCHSCNCGRTISKREDPFDLYCANTGYFNGKCCLRVQWNYKLYINSSTAAAATSKDNKKDNASHYNDGFNVCNHGGAELYHKQTGITQPGFDRYNCFLLRWDIPAASCVYLFHQHYKQKNQRYRDNYYNKRNPRMHAHVNHAQYHNINDENLGLWIHKIRKTVSIAKTKPNSNAYFPCFVGLEFECYRGHRGILQLETDQNGADDEADDENNNDDNLRFVGIEFPTRHVPLRVPCKQCYSAKSGKNINIINAQLQRAFIVTPPPPISITAQPEIVSAQSDAIFEFDTPVVLPPSSFLVLRFPYIYFHDGRGLPPDKLSLSKAMLVANIANTAGAAGANQANSNSHSHHTHIQQTPQMNKKTHIVIKHK